MLVDQLPYLVNVALGENPPVVDQQDVWRHQLDLVQDVTRDDDRLACFGPILDHLDRSPATKWVHTGQWLVE